MRTFLLCYLLIFFESTHAANYQGKLTYTYDTFDTDFAEWHMLSPEIKGDFASSDLIIRANVADRFDTTAVQGEFEYYPLLGERRYAEFIASYANTTIFPDLKFRGEIYQGFLDGYEASFGLQKIWFADRHQELLWSASLAKYLGAYYFLIRPNFIAGDRGQFSIQAEGRRYFDDVSYVVFKGGKGKISNRNNVTGSLFKLSSTWGSFGVVVSAFDDFLLEASYTYTDTEISQNRSRKQTSYILGIGRSL